jgi:hypothetical protein
VVQRDTLYGQEAKPLPYMLVQMNLQLHGLVAPELDGAIVSNDFPSFEFRDPDQCDAAFMGWLVRSATFVLRLNQAPPAEPGPARGTRLVP